MISDRKRSLLANAVRLVPRNHIDHVELSDSLQHWIGIKMPRRCHPIEMARLVVIEVHVPSADVDSADAQ